jgi:uncharacterized protein YktA (UPF0223 family)
MNNLDTIEEMRKNLSSMNEALTPYSGKVEHQRYIDNLKHYKNILNTTLFRLISEVDESIEKSYKIIRGFAITDINNLKAKIDNGRR